MTDTDHSEEAAVGPGSPAGQGRRPSEHSAFWGYVLKRLGATIPVLLGVSFICYAILSAAPGDPVRILMGQHYDEQIANELRSNMGLDRPFLVQYGMFLGRVVRGDLGRSYVKNLPVSEYLAPKFVNTMKLTLVAMFIAIVFGIGAGIISAAWNRSFWDYFFMLLAGAGMSRPVFWLGMLLQLFFANHLHWLPVSDMSYSGDPHSLWLGVNENYMRYLWDLSIKYFILPGFTLATVPMAIIARLTRSSMLEVMQLDYIRQARAKGLSYQRVVLTHALRNALIPIITVVGNNFAVLLTGAVLTETVFAWPGMGRAMVEAINQLDYPVVLGGVMIMAVVFVIVNLIVDMTYGLVDPRVRYG